jgi:hypothetical protein
MNMAKKDTSHNRAEEGLFEYRLVLHPDASVNEKVKAETALLFDDDQQQALVQAPSYITVARFLAREPMEATLMRWIQRICDFQQQFMVTLNNYSGFPPDTIYLRIQEPAPFNSLARQLKSVDDWVQSSSCPPMNLVAKPYLSIARQLPEPVYTKAMFSYSQKIFHESFMATELRLLRRAHQFEQAKTIQVFPLARTHQRLYEKEIA